MTSSSLFPSRVLSSAASSLPLHGAHTSPSRPTKPRQREFSRAASETSDQRAPTIAELEEILETQHYQLFSQGYIAGDDAPHFQVESEVQNIHVGSLAGALREPNYLHDAGISSSASYSCQQTKSHYDCADMRSVKTSVKTSQSTHGLLSSSFSARGLYLHMSTMRFHFYPIYAYCFTSYIFFKSAETPERLQFMQVCANESQRQGRQFR